MRLIGTAVAIVAVIFFVAALLLNGDGGFKRMTTMSGIYAVERPAGHDVVCFVERSSGAMDCIKEPDGGDDVRD